MNVDFYKSTDGGRSLNKVKVPHGDNHGLWIDPLNNRRMIASNDGGVSITLDGGKSWSREDNQPNAQVYHVITDTRTPYYIYGAQQDNTTIAIASRSDDGSIGRADWYAVGGGGVILLRAVDVVRRPRVGDDVVKLSGWLVVLATPG